MARNERLKIAHLSRRRLLTGAAAGGGLLVAWWLWPRSYPGPLEPGAGETPFGAWLTIARDGVVTVAVPQLEMGQGVMTLLAQVVAMELGADWRQIAVEPAPPAGVYANLPLAARWSPLWSAVPALAKGTDSVLVDRFARENAFIATADGTTLDAYERPCREAAAVARAMLAMAAADQWGVTWEECEVAGGFVTHGEKRMGFGALAAAAGQFDPPEPAPLRPDPVSEVSGDSGEEQPIIFPRLDLPAKVDGSWLFAGDIRLPGLVYASIRHGPLGAEELLEFDEAAARKMRGLVGVVRSKRWLAAVADGWWTADRALAAMRPVFTGPGGVESAGVEEMLDAALRQEDGERIATIGDPDDAFGEKPDIARRYHLSAAVQAPIETASATARYTDGLLELWIASQAPEAARTAAARAIGLSPRDVVIYPTAAGGSFDARLEHRHAIEVAQIAREIGRPVQLTWSRAQELQAVPPRTPILALLSARFSPTPDRMPHAWRTRLAMPATVREFGERLFNNATPAAAIRRTAGQADPMACEGAVPPYAIPNVAVEHHPVELPHSTGRMRGNAAAYTAFFTESFLDELAREAGADPFLYRMGLLTEAPRMADCLRRATRIGGWDGGQQGTGQGLAMVRMGDDISGGRIACVAQATLSQGGLRVTRLSAAVDIGRVINADIARQQIEGGLIYGLSLAMGSAVTYESGRPNPLRIGGLSLPTLADTPDITIDLIASDAPPFDPGELGVAVAPPAIATALHSATGLRFRRLPLLSEGL